MREKHVFYNVHRKIFICFVFSEVLFGFLPKPCSNSLYKLNIVYIVSVKSSTENCMGILCCLLLLLAFAHGACFPVACDNGLCIHVSGVLTMGIL